VRPPPFSPHRCHNMTLSHCRTGMKPLHDRLAGRLTMRKGSRRKRGRKQRKEGKHSHVTSRLQASPRFLSSSVTLTKVLVDVTRRKEVDKGYLERLDLENSGNADAGPLRVIGLVGRRRKVEASVLVGWRSRTLVSSDRGREEEKGTNRSASRRLVRGHCTPKSPCPP
jgi:hypothetical protein